MNLFDRGWGQKSDHENKCFGSKKYIFSLFEALKRGRG
jgi:hypothetical protein